MYFFFVESHENLLCAVLQFRLHYAFRNNLSHLPERTCQVITANEDLSRTDAREAARDRTIHWIYDHYDPRITYVCNNPITGLYVTTGTARHFISCLLYHFYDDRDILLRIIRRGILREIICQVTSEPGRTSSLSSLCSFNSAFFITRISLSLLASFYLVVKLFN